MLDELAAEYGLRTRFENGLDEPVTASTGTVLAVLRALGVPIERPEQAGDFLAATRQDLRDELVPPVVVAWDGRLDRLPVRIDQGDPERLTLEVELESGVSMRWGPRLPASRTDDGFAYVSIPDELSLGYHTLRACLPGRECETLVISAPRFAYGAHDEPSWGVFLPLYALHCRTSRGAGHYGDIARLLKWMREQGGRVVGTLPLLASFLDEPFDPSPYTPVTRRAWNELYLDIETIPELESCEAARRRLESPDLQRVLDRLQKAEHVDYREQAALQRSVLEPLAESMRSARGARREAFESFQRSHPTIESYARFRGALRRHGLWQHWPTQLMEGTIGEADVDLGEYCYHQYVQWIAEEQVQRLGSDGLYLDLPLGVHPEGFDAWHDRSVFCPGISVGAPPDGFFLRGQNWGFPPLDPAGLRRSRYRYWIDSLRFHMRSAGLLRIDHVMAFERLYWIPTGASAVDGLYVHYPTDELFAIACLESQRARCGLVGEDLGTVTPEVRAQLDEHRLQRMYVLPFEMQGEPDEPLAPVHPRAVASLGTHDTVPFEAWRQGDDVRLARRLDLIEDEQAAQDLAGRVESVQILEQWLSDRDLLEGSDDLALLRACLRWLSGSPAPMVLVNLEDLWGERRSQNVPGTTTEHENWTRRATFGFEAFSQDERVIGVLRELDRVRRRLRKEPS